MLKKLDFQPFKLTWNKEYIIFSKTIDRMTIFEWWFLSRHYDDVIMGAIASQIISLTIIYSIVYSDVDQRKHQSSASLAFVQGIHRGPVNSPHKWPVMWNMFPFDDVIMWIRQNTFHMQNTITMMSQCIPLMPEKLIELKSQIWEESVIPVLMTPLFTQMQILKWRISIMRCSIYFSIFCQSIQLKTYLVSFERHLPQRLTLFPCYSGLPHWHCGNHLK